MGTIVTPSNGSNIYKGATVPVSYRSDTVDFDCGILSRICTIIYLLGGPVTGNIPISQTGAAPQTQAAQNIVFPLVGGTATIDVQGWGVGGQLNDNATATVNLIDVPTANCAPATLITNTTAQLNGTIAGTLLPGGSARFVWGTPGNNAATTYITGNVSANITGLTPNTNYNYHVEVLDEFNNIVATSTQCNFTTTATIANMCEIDLVSLCNITGVTRLCNLDTEAEILLVTVTTSKGDVIPTDSTDFVAPANHGVFTTIGFFRSYYADLNGNLLVPQPTNIGVCGASSDDFEPFILCDDATSFLRQYVRDKNGIITFIDTALDGVTPYTVVGNVKICDNTTLPLDARIANVAGTAVTAVTQNIVALIPAGKVLVSLSMSILSGTATIVDFAGTSVTALPVGFSATWSADVNGELNYPVSVTAAINSRVVLTYTLR